MFTLRRDFAVRECSRSPQVSDLHVHVWRLEAALVDVVVCEGLCGVGAVLVHRDGHFAMSHPSAVWT